jgi:hypothetical protein
MHAPVATGAEAIPEIKEVGLPHVVSSISVADAKPASKHFHARR